MKQVGLLLVLICAVVGVIAVQAGWIRSDSASLIIQSFTTEGAIRGNNTGSITTNGNSYQYAGDNSGTIFIGGAGNQVRGSTAGALAVDGTGAAVLGEFGSMTEVENHGKGSIILGNLGTGQKATVTDVGHSSLLLGAGTVSNSQSIVVGDGMESHGSKSITAGSVWALGAGFAGNAAGLTNVPADLAMSGRVTAVSAQAGALSNALDGLASNNAILDAQASVAVLIGMWFYI